MGSRSEILESSSSSTAAAAAAAAAAAETYTARYVRKSKTIGVLWTVFIVCYAVLLSVAFMANDWIGTGTGTDDDTDTTQARIGLWSICYKNLQNGDQQCSGQLRDFFDDLSIFAFKIATIATFIAVLFAVFSSMAMVLAFCCQLTFVIRLSATFQLISAVSLLIGCCCYPFGWSEIEIRKICGIDAGQYRIGDCKIRWSFILAIVCCIDSFMLSILAFVFAHNLLKFQKITANLPRVSTLGRNRYVPPAASISTSRKSLNLHPVMLMQPHRNRADDTFSQFSHKMFNTTTLNRSRTLSMAQFPSSTIQSFQL